MHRTLKILAGIVCLFAVQFVAERPASAAYVGMIIRHHALVETAQGPRRVWRLYALFSDPNDRLLGWGGTPLFGHATIRLGCTQQGGNAGVFYNLAGSTSNRAPYLDQIKFNPDHEWDSFTTIGVPIADLGSGPPRTDPNAAAVSPGFPTFLVGSTFTTAPVGAWAFVSDTEPHSDQGLAGYGPAGDLQNETLMAQITTHPDDWVEVLGLAVQTKSATGTVSTATNQSISHAAAFGRCCLPDGTCGVPTYAVNCIIQFGGRFHGCNPCETCEPFCIEDIAPPGGNGIIDGDDLAVLLSQWGPCPSGCAGDLSVPGNYKVDVDDLVKLLGAWGDCPVN